MQMRKEEGIIHNFVLKKINYSFFPHAVVLWNSLPYTVVNAGSLEGQNI
jgi:hypothetical protein